MVSWQVNLCSKIALSCQTILAYSGTPALDAFDSTHFDQDMRCINNQRQQPKTSRKSLSCDQAQSHRWIAYNTSTSIYIPATQNYHAECLRLLCNSSLDTRRVVLVLFSTPGMNDQIQYFLCIRPKTEATEAKQNNKSNERRRKQWMVWWHNEKSDCEWRGTGTTA